MSGPAVMPTPSEERDPALVRSAAYAFLAEAFAYPTRGTRGRLLRHAVLLSKDLARGGAAGEAAPLTESLIRAARQIRTTSLDQHTHDHVALFGHSAGGGCPPYETEYGPASDVIAPNCLADLAGFYRAFGLAVAPDAAERPDHVTIECEFLHYLTFKEAHARRRRLAEPLAVVREAQRQFLQGHFARWTPVFARQLQRLGEGSFYGDVGDFLSRFVASECVATGADPKVELGLAPYAPPTDDDLCVGCRAAASCGAAPRTALAAGP